MGILEWFSRRKLQKPGINFQEVLSETLAKLQRDEIGKGDLPELGRSSREEPEDILSAFIEYNTYFQGINPAIPIDWLDFLVDMAAVNPDVSQAVKNYENFANTGHIITIDGNESTVQKAMDRIDQKAYSLYKRSIGIDGLINHYIREICISGALSSEDVISPKLDGVQEVAIVPASKIRFKFENGEYVPYQALTFYINGENMIRLNPITYSYFAWRNVHNSPYAYPPFTSAIESILMQHDAMTNVKMILRKIGLIGLIMMQVERPARAPNETEESYQARLTSYLRKVAETSQKNFYKGLAVHFNDIEIKHANVASDARGSNDLLDRIEQFVFSGLGTMPALHGRTYSTTETYAGVVYNMLVNDALNIQRLPKRRMEKTYRLDLLLAGIPIDGISLSFNPIQKLNRSAEAQADEIDIRNVITKMDRGFISPDQAAQELGYDGVYDESLAMNQPSAFNVLKRYKAEQVKKTKLHVVRRFRFDRASNSYRLNTSPIVLQEAEQSA